MLDIMIKVFKTNAAWTKPYNKAYIMACSFNVYHNKKISSL